MASVDSMQAYEVRAVFVKFKITAIAIVMLLAKKYFYSLRDQLLS